MSTIATPAIGLRISPRGDGGYDVTVWRDDGEVASSYTEASYHEAVDRGVAWLRDARGQG